ncbi:MAG: phosphatase PAP2 family protein [Bacteroidaceae bacterium]|nr:phosphatase PAP2 family protein [Bacteroidaceae bacterium]
MDVQQIIAWDKELLLMLNGSDSIVWDQLMFLATKTIVWVPFFFSLLYLVVKNSSAHKALLIIGCVAVCFAVSEGVSSGICKPLVARFRPTHDPEIMGLVQTVNGLKGGLYSFFSSHAANTFSLSFFLSLVVRHWLFTTSVFSWACFHTYTRIYLGLHFPGDILTGFCFGCLWGVTLYFIYCWLSRRWFPSHDYVSEECTISGFSLLTVYIVALTFLLNLFGVMVGSFFLH